jgi:membrane-anchored protein YejM (alkaline phosphatase superfamily)
MTVIKSIEIISWAKIHALFGIVFGLVYGVLFAIMGTAIGAAYSMPGATTLGLLSIIVFPIIFGIMAFICGAILAFIYNIFASKVGGIEIELAEKKA